jgi:hypothetical protein
MEASAAEARAAHHAEGVGEADGAASRAEGGPALSEPRRQHAGRDAATDEEDEAEARMSAARSPKKRKNPRGGLTAAGRRWFARREGAKLKPGVKKRRGRMTPDDMRRKGSWAVRFYGRPRLPRLRDRHGKPTRFALTAVAWGEPVPRTVAAARRIARRGEALLAAYRRKKKRTR